MENVLCSVRLRILKVCFATLIIFEFIFLLNFPVAKDTLLRLGNIKALRKSEMPSTDSKISRNDRSNTKKDTNVDRTISADLKRASDIYRNNTNTNKATVMDRTVSGDLTEASHVYKNATTLWSKHSECTGDVTLAPVDLRIILLTQKRTKSLKACLDHINNAEYHGEKVVLDIWIDREKNTEALNKEHFEMVKKFTFKSHIIKCVHIQDKHVGIYGQWIDTWNIGPNNKEIGVILEDDVDVSPYFYKWLKSVHLKYQHREDVSGVGLSTTYPDPVADRDSCWGRMNATGQRRNKCNKVRVPLKNNTVYMYKIPTTWGFSPKLSSWKKFQTWYHDIRRSNKTFRPIIDAKIIHNTWYN
ncbi:unnamed protein product [Owenia fusiformis]|uniref:Uncharacterized protein n=1 Tax=Owenia fusiformis TaxID=6347 RepID=A0A8S4NKK1_OWEFU|nr:unnamed protein product [Owenia fusiformis]